MESLAEFAKAFHTLGSESRLLVYTVLLENMPAGLNVKELQEKTNIKPSTLAHHLKFLVDNDFVRQEQKGKEIINYAIKETLITVCSNITDRCCTGKIR